MRMLEWWWKGRNITREISARKVDNKHFMSPEPEWNERQLNLMDQSGFLSARKHLCQIAVILRRDFSGTRITTKKLLELCASLLGGTVFENGGHLFESWFWFAGNSALVQRCLKELRDTSRLSINTQTQVINSERVKFYFFVLKSLKDMSCKNTDQLFFISFLLEWKGLSMNGLASVAHLNITLHENTYRRWKLRLVAKVHEQSKQLLQTKSMIIWVDNFAKIFPKALVAVGGDSCTDIKLTAIGGHILPDAFEDCFLLSPTNINSLSI
eukprot:TRINITY_DN10745_c0_g1_i1.p1 TRINITY_DN10745_c0_g1~~TRINITY_DN10745_c0_g1_i1.p1  ORF type:complete len:269 (+),score=37.16 TRINITY_DN10745_c0_g1_i1:344-1150(+)